MWALFGCGGVVLAVVLGSLIGALFIRASVTLSNKLLGPLKPKTRYSDEWSDWEEWQEWDAEDERRATGRKKRDDRLKIPEPGFGKGIGIAIVSGALTAVAGVIVRVIVDEIRDDLNDTGDVQILVSLILTPIIVGIYTILLRAMLPTTFGRALLVAFVNLILVVVVGLIAGGAIALVW